MDISIPAQSLPMPLTFANRVCTTRPEILEASFSPRGKTTKSEWIYDLLVGVFCFLGTKNHHTVG